MIALRFALPFAALVLAPLGLWVAGATVRTIGLVLGSAVVLGASLALDAQSLPAWVSAAMVLPFAAATAWAARQLPVRVPVAYLVAGAVVIALARLELAIPGFPEALLLLTAIHAWYAGFAACLFAACTGLELQQRAASLWFRIPAGILAVTPVLLTAAVPVSPYLEAAVSFAQTLAVTAVSALALVATIGSPNRLRSFGLSVAAACAVFGMAAAAIYAGSRFGKLYWLPVPELAALHAIAMGAGFSFIGLLAWAGQRTRFQELQTRSGASSRVPS